MEESEQNRIDPNSCQVKLKLFLSPDVKRFLLSCRCVLVDKTVYSYDRVLGG